MSVDDIPSRLEGCNIQWWHVDVGVSPSHRYGRLTSLTVLTVTRTYGSGRVCGDHAQGAVRCVAFCPPPPHAEAPDTSHWVATASDDGTARVWEAPLGTCLFILKVRCCVWLHC